MSTGSGSSNALSSVGVGVTIVEHGPDRRTGEASGLPTVPLNAEPQTVVEAVRGLLEEITGRWLPVSEALSLPGGLQDLATTARVPTLVPYQLASLVLDVPVACPGDPWSVVPLRAWVPAAALERVRAIPLHFDGHAIHYATPDVPTPELSETIARTFGVSAARGLLCTPESVGIWSLPGDPARREARPELENALTESAVWMTTLRRLPLPGSLLHPLAASVGVGASTTVVVGDVRATDVLAPIVGPLTGQPVAHAEVPSDVHAWLAFRDEVPPAPTPVELVEQLRGVPATLRGLGWHAALSGTVGDERVRVAAWALGVPWLSAELAALVAAHWPQPTYTMLDPDWAVWPPPEDGDRHRRQIIGVPPIDGHLDPTRDAYAAALLTNPLADALPVGGAAEAMSRVHAGAALDEALTEVAPDLPVSSLLAEHLGLPTVDLDPRPRAEVGIDALGRTCRTADWDDPVCAAEHSMLAEPGVVPVRTDPDGSLLVAVADPLSPGLAARLSDTAARPVRIAVAARDQVQRARTRLLARRSLAEATLNADLSSPHWDRVALHSAQWKVSPAQAILDLGLDADATTLTPDRMMRRTEDSAQQVLTPGQKAVLASIALVVGAAVTLAPWWTLSALILVAMVLLVAAGAHRTWEALRALHRKAPSRTFAADEDGLPPVMTVLIPLDRRAEVTTGFVARLHDFDYPTDRLDVKLLVDHADTRTREALAAARIPDFAEVLVVPPSVASGRFKAANFGLLHARGKFVALHDPSTRPQRRLLRQAVGTFGVSASDVVCLQPGLRHRNGAPGPIGRLLSAVYDTTFGGLFALCNGRQPIPLGPTSTFFVTDWLRTAGGWDPHNRTAQADLGVRIRRLGGRVAPLDGVVDHVVESDLRGWLRRYARCLVGYAQTYLVHMRRPRQLREELGLGGFIGFQFAVAGTALAFVVYPVLWSLIGLWALGVAGWVPRLIPGSMQVGVCTLATGTALFVLAHLLTRHRGDGTNWRLMLSPWYWSLRAAKLWHVVRRPLRGR